VSDEAAKLLNRFQNAAGAIGDDWLVTMPDDPNRLLSRHVCTEVVGQDCEDRRDSEREVMAALGGWRSTAPILKCYQMPDEATHRAGLAARKPLFAAGLAR